jgi:hypothetical protein
MNKRCKGVEILEEEIQTSGDYPSDVEIGKSEGSGKLLPSSYRIGSSGGPGL